MRDGDGMIRLVRTKDDMVVLAAGLDAAARMFGSQLSQTGTQSVPELLPKLKAIQVTLAKLQTALEEAELDARRKAANGEHTSAVTQN